MRNIKEVINGRSRVVGKNCTVTISGFSKGKVLEGLKK